ncbi:adenylate/guanylate cyclase domain-containing protein [Planctomycetes bacterium K23_9]|uniref:Adenylate cyclase 1 n=1 Tax=Stieleria marina TaxID=1930275 RepID=A0A517P2W5_9BACT|nr:Adenylate cyclase 1 [Planctomycetes bacterium K23_9]
MPDLIAQGPASMDRWRREIPNVTSGAEITVGRSDADWNVPWDSLISRKHIKISPRGNDAIQVTVLPSSRNPVFHRGQQSRQFVLVPGDHFAIGKTTFTLANRPGASDVVSPGNVTSHAYDHKALRRRGFRDVSSRIDMLSRLPDLITSSGSDEELLVRVTSVMLQATPSASAVAVVAIDNPSCEEVDGQAVNVLHYDSRLPDGFDSLADSKGPAVSSRLVREAIRKRESTLHLWSAARSDQPAFTATEEVDWSFCVPLRSEACPGWALYVTGDLATPPGADLGQSLQAAPDDLTDDVKFAELVGTTIANLRQSRRLERRQANMRHFFAPVVMSALAGRDTDEVLEPREADLSVMFCDLRGFSQRSERDADHLLELLANVSDALGVMTRHILGTDGVIGDFHGDAAMGFWGWPLPQANAANRAAEAAIRIRRENAAADEASRFRCGIGIASGRAVAGRIGTSDQVKVTAFGPVVNLASRLEGITKAFGADVILDSATTAMLKQTPQQDAFRLRRLAVVRPAGFESPVEISELLPSDLVERSANQSGLSDQVLTNHEISEYEASLDALIRGDWDEAYERLHCLPPWDRPKDMLLSTILKHNRTPPSSWDGVIDIPKL